MSLDRKLTKEAWAQYIGWIIYYIFDPFGKSPKECLWVERRGGTSLPNHYSTYNRCVEGEDEGHHLPIYQCEQEPKANSYKLPLTLLSPMWIINKREIIGDDYKVSPHIIFHELNILDELYVIFLTSLVRVPKNVFGWRGGVRHHLIIIWHITVIWCLGLKEKTDVILYSFTNVSKSPKQIVINYPSLFCHIRE